VVDTSDIELLVATGIIVVAVLLAVVVVLALRDRGNR
jgi:hypothetical protein